MGWNVFGAKAIWAWTRVVNPRPTFLPTWSERNWFLQFCQQPRAHWSKGQGKSSQKILETIMACFVENLHGFRNCCLCLEMSIPAWRTLPCSYSWFAGRPGRTKAGRLKASACRCFPTTASALRPQLSRTRSLSPTPASKKEQKLTVSFPFICVVNLVDKRCNRWMRRSLCVQTKENTRIKTAFPKAHPGKLSFLSQEIVAVVHVTDVRPFSLPTITCTSFLAEGVKNKTLETLTWHPDKHGTCPSHLSPSNNTEMSFPCSDNLCEGWSEHNLFRGVSSGSSEGQRRGHGRLWKVWGPTQQPKDHRMLWFQREFQQKVQKKRNFYWVPVFWEQDVLALQKRCCDLTQQTFKIPCHRKECLTTFEPPFELQTRWVVPQGCTTTWAKMHWSSNAAARLHVLAECSDTQ